MIQSLDWMAAANHCGFFSLGVFQAPQEPIISMASVRDIKPEEHHKKLFSGSALPVSVYQAHQTVNANSDTTTSQRVRQFQKNAFIETSSKQRF
jgi:hypothetical protein